MSEGLPPDAVFQNVLVAIDGSEPSMRAAQTAIRLARAFAARLTLLYVIDAALVSELARFGGKSEAVARRDLSEHGRRYLDLLAEQAARSELPVETVVREGNPFREIVDQADAHGIDLITIGHVGRHGTGHYLIGSVAERVLDFAPCPVLVVR